MLLNSCEVYNSQDSYCFLVHAVIFDISCTNSAEKKLDKRTSARKNFCTKVLLHKRNFCAKELHCIRNSCHR